MFTLIIYLRSYHYLQAFSIVIPTLEPTKDEGLKQILNLGILGLSQYPVEVAMNMKKVPGTNSALTRTEHYQEALATLGEYAPQPSWGRGA